MTEGMNSFNLELPEGNYIWNVLCSNTYSAFALDNYTLNIDSINPNLTLTQPTGTKTSRTGIALTFSVSDASPIYCWYNVEWATGGSVIGNTTISNCSSTSFNVAADGNYLLNLYANDSAGNFNSTNSSFSVDTSTPPTPPSGGSGSSGGGGGGGGGNYTSSGAYNIEVSGISDLVLDPGETRRISVTAKNTGRNFLNDCVIRSKGANSEWSTSSDVKDVGPGQLQEFIFNLNVPLNLLQGSYPVELALECKEFSKSFGFSVEIIEKKLEIILLDAERNKDDEINVSYSLNELSGNNQEVEINIVLLGSKNEKIAEIYDTKTIEANSRNNVSSILKIESELKGNFNLLINAKSSVASSLIQEEVSIGSYSLLGGLVIFLNSDKSDYIILAVLVTAFLVFCFFMIKRIFKKKTQRKEGVIKVIKVGKNVKKVSRENKR